MDQNQEGKHNNGIIREGVRFCYNVLTPRIFTITAIAGLLTFLENGGPGGFSPWFLSLLLANLLGILVITRLVGEIGIVLTILVEEWHSVFYEESSKTADSLPHVVARSQEQRP